MFKIKLFILNSFFLIPFLSFGQTETAGATFPNTIQIENEKASLSGVGIKKRVWVKEYAIGLYHNESTTNADKIIRSDKPMGVRIQVLSKFLPRTKYITDLEEGFEKSILSDTRPIKTKIDRFFSLLDENLGRSDVLKFLYHPDIGVKVYINSKFKGIIKGDKFRQALWSNWIHDKCADKELKNKLLANAK